MKKLYTSLLAIFAIFVFFNVALAQDDTRYYDVEVIIFENLAPNIKQAEDWPGSIEYEYPEKALFIGDPYPGLLPANLNPRYTFKPIIRAKYMLAEEARLLAKSEKYKILYHRAWRQPGLDEENAIAVKIKRTFTPRRNTSPLPSGADITESTDYQAVDNTYLPVQTSPDELFGTIRVILKRYLHVQTDLHFKTYKLERQNMVNQEFEAISEPQLRPIIVSLKDSRKMRSKELHYIDNPVIGMLVYIKQFKTK